MRRPLPSASLAAFVLASLALAGDASAQSQTFNTPGEHSVPVPAGATGATVELNGAGGGRAGGGKGGQTVASFGVTPGEVLQVVVGGAGGFSGGLGGGGSGGTGFGQPSGGGGGGRSAIRKNSQEFLTAGGGGGATSQFSGGDGGGSEGNPGSGGASAGYGGTQGGGGAGANAGTSLTGGAGASGFSAGTGGGGGGGGYHGGGGGFSGFGGGGGSGYVGGIAGATTTTGGGAAANTNGSVIITWVIPNPQPIANAGSDQTVNTCPGTTASITLDGSASSDPNGSIASYSWKESGSEIATGSAPTVLLAVGTHTITLTVTDDEGAMATDHVVVTVNAIGSTLSTTFTFTNGNQSFPIPAGVTSLTVDLKGAGGTSGGAGGRTIATFGVSAGDAIQVIVGGCSGTIAGGFGGGGAGGLGGNTPGFGGGGCSSIRKNSQEWVTAGGGGGGASAGSGGGLQGTPGSGAGGGGGGTQSMGGAGGTGAGAGALGSGGAGVTTSGFFSSPSGGGGGGHYGGGGGATGHGGGGGSSFWHTSATNASTTTGGAANPGQPGSVTISWIVPGSPSIANAGSDETVSTCPGTTVSFALDGSASTGSCGAIASYSWKENGSEIATGSAPTVDLSVGTHTITLIVTDEQGATATDDVVITVNPTLTSNAGPDQRMCFEGGPLPTIPLDGSASQGAGSYLWEQTGEPAVTLSDAAAVQPTFVPLHVDGAVTYTFRLTRSQGDCTTTDTVQVTVKHTNLPPTADAGSDQPVNEGAAVNLSGTGGDGDDDPVTLAWSQSTGDASQVALVGASTATPSFTAPALVGPHTCPARTETLSFTLTVSDGIAQATDTMAVTVADVNQAPVGVSAGLDQSVCEGDTVTLAGAASDPDGDALTYTWTRISGDGPETLCGPSPSFPAPLAPPGGATLSYRLTVSDALGSTDACALVVTTTDDPVNVHVKHINQPPVAMANGPTGTVPEGTLVTLDGCGSYDPDMDAIAAYQWTQEPADPRFMVVLIGANTAQPSFIAPDVDPTGVTLRFHLVVTDPPNAGYCGTGSLSSPPDTIEVCVGYVNTAPMADAGPEQTVNEGAQATLDGSGSADPDENDLTYTWTRLEGPAVTLSGADTANPTFTAPAVLCAGNVLVFQLTVADGYGGTDTDVVLIALDNVNGPPTADAGGSQSVAEGASVALVGMASDPDGETLTITWQQIGSPTVTLSGANGLTPGFEAPLLDCGGDPTCKVTLKFRLTVADTCGGITTDEVEVTVANEDHDPIASAGGPQSLCEGSPVWLNGSASYDPDGDPLTYAWAQDPADPLQVSLQDPSSPLASFVAPWVSAGTPLHFTLTVSDPFGGTKSDTATITVGNCNTPPDCTWARPSVAQLWPPNHALVAVSILGVADPDNNATITILSVTQDEPTNGLGDGDTGPDAFIQGSTVLLRAERSGNGNGRVYRITFRAADVEGGCTSTVTVGVPHSMKKPVSWVDDGLFYDSTE